MTSISKLLPGGGARSAGGERGPANPNVVLTIILACYLMIVLDASVIITALPKIHHSLGFSSTGLSWVQNAYTLTFGGLMLLGARAGDILGRRRMFVAGIALFTVASFAAGLGQSASWLLAARAIQGVGAAVAAPATLSLLMMTFRDGHERTRALSWYSAVAGGGGSVGLVVGGMLASWASWRWGLFVNVPIGAALIYLAPRYLPETDRTEGRFDLTGAITSTLGMIALVYGFVRAGDAGWGDSMTLASFAASIVLLAGFVATELRAPQPITPLKLFASRERSGAYAARIATVGGLFATFFFLTQFLQGVRGFSAIEAGLAFLPMTAVMFSMGRVVPRLVPRFGNYRLLTVGLALALVGIAWLSRLGDGTAFFPAIAVPLAILGVGMGLAFAPLTAAGIAGVEPSEAGAASGLVNVAHQLGGSLGIGILVAIFASASRSATDHPLAGASAAQQASHALAHGVGAALTGSTVLVAIALLLALVVMRPRRAEAEVAAAVAPVVSANSEAR